jgi:hypothetical protein
MFLFVVNFEYIDPKQFLITNSTFNVVGQNK